MKFRTSAIAAACMAIGIAAPAMAQTVKLGVVNTYSGPFAAAGEQLDRGIRLYMKQHEKDLPPGVKLEIIRRDDTGPNPEVAKRMAQELITRDNVQLLAGAVYTPNALAIAPLATEAKVPFIIMNAGTAMITTKSPYIARTSFTMWQSSYPLGAWAAKNGIKNAYIAVTDFGPGHRLRGGIHQGLHRSRRQDRRLGAHAAEQPRLRAVHAARQGCQARCRLFVFVPAGKDATALMKAFGDLGLKQAGIKLIGPGDITTDEELQNMGDVRARRGHDASITPPRRPAGQQGIRQGVQGGVRRQRGARTSSSSAPMTAWRRSST